MTRYKVSELEGALLDAAAAKADGWAAHLEPVEHWLGRSGRYSSEWVAAGPIIERDWRPITSTLFEWFGTKWRDSIDGKPGDVLRWFIRAYVASKFGDEVDL